MFIDNRLLQMLMKCSMIYVTCMKNSGFCVCAFRESQHDKLHYVLCYIQYLPLLLSFIARGNLVTSSPSASYDLLARHPSHIETDPKGSPLPPQQASALLLPTFTLYNILHYIIFRKEQHLLAPRSSSYGTYGFRGPTKSQTRS